jgi:phage N-6-adenine-methyltransferase
MPTQKPGRSKQDYETPTGFLEAVKSRFNISAFACDLAASPNNAKALHYFTEIDDSLKQDWTTLKDTARGPFTNLWLNPPFGHIEPWARKCAVSTREQKNLRIFLLTPASVGANWFAKWVFPDAFVMALQGRLSFDGTAPFPKDCLLSIFGNGEGGFELWDWRLTRAPRKAA